jgi:hypothetical protein
MVLTYYYQGGLEIHVIAPQFKYIDRFGDKDPADCGWEDIIVVQWLNNTTSQVTQCGKGCALANPGNGPALLRDKMGRQFQWDGRTLDRMSNPLHTLPSKELIPVSDSPMTYNTMVTKYYSGPEITRLGKL